MSNYDNSKLTPADLAEDDFVRVTYNSAHSDKRQSFEGIVTSLGRTVSIDPEEDMPDGEPRIYELGHDVCIDTGYGYRRISEMCNADIRIELLNDDDEDEMDATESAHALINASEGDVITLTYEPPQEKFDRQSKTVEVTEAPYLYYYEHEDDEAAEVIVKDIDRDDDASPYVRLYAYTHPDGTVYTGIEGYAETRHDIDTIGAIRRLGDDIRVESITPAADTDTDDSEPEPVAVTDGGVDVDDPHNPASQYDETPEAVAFRNADEIATLVELTKPGDRLRINGRTNLLTVREFYETGNGTRELMLEGNGTYYTLRVTDETVTLMWNSGSESVSEYRVTNRNAYNISTYENILTEEVETVPWRFEWGERDRHLDADEAAHAHRALSAMVEDYRNRFNLEDDYFGECYRDMLALRVKFDQWADDDGYTVHGHEQGILGAALDYARESPDVREIFERLEAEAAEPEPEVVTDGGFDELLEAHNGAETGEALTRDEVADLEDETTVTLAYRTTQGTDKSITATVNKAWQGAYYAIAFLTTEDDKERTFHVYKSGRGTLFCEHDAPGGGRRLSDLSRAYIVRPEPEPVTDGGREYPEPRSYKELIESEETPDPLAEGEHVESDHGVRLARLEGVHCEEFIVSAGTINNVVMDREEIGLLAELAGFEVEER